MMYQNLNFSYFPPDHFLVTVSFIHLLPFVFCGAVLHAWSHQCEGVWVLKSRKTSDNIWVQKTLFTGLTNEIN